MRRRALLVGCNYPGSPNELKGCANDVLNIRALLLDLFDYKPADVSVLLDTEPQTQQPTGANIKTELTRLVSITEPDDVLFFHFSGHGTQVPTDDLQNEEDGLDEAIVPTDMNLVLDDDLRVIMCKIPRGARFTMLSDCCHSGTMLDHKPRQLASQSSRQLPAGEMPQINQAPWRSKSLPYEALLAQLSQAVGEHVDQGNLRYSLTQAFGEDASLKAQAYMGMLGEAFKAEVAANGGKLPPLGVRTLVRLAGRLWLKRKIFHGKQKLGGVFGLQGKKQKKTSALESLLHHHPNPPPTPPHDPHAAYLQHTDISKIMGLHLPEDRRPHESTYASLKPYYQTDEDGVSKYHKIMAAAGYYVHPSKLNPRAAPFANPGPAATASQQAEGGHRPVETADGGNPSASSSAMQQEGANFSSQAAAAEQVGMVGGMLNSHAPPYHPPRGSAASPPSYPSGSPLQQQQAGRQGLQSPNQGLPNPVSQRTGQQSGANPAEISGHSGQFANPNAQMGPHPQQGQQYMGGSVGAEREQPRATGGHRQHLAQKLHLPMDWHTDILAGRAPATFSPLGDQATSGYFPPVCTPSSAMHTSEFMPNQAHHQRFSPNPKRYAQHALRVSAQALGHHHPYSQGGHSLPPQQLTHAQTHQSQGYQAAGNLGSAYPGCAGSGYANPSQNPTMSGHRPQSPSVVVYPGQNPGMNTYLSHHPNQGLGYVQQHPGYPTQGAGTHMHAGGYTSQSPPRPDQGPGYPNQHPGYPYQGAGFTITPLRRPGQAATPSQAAAYPHQSPHHLAQYPPQTLGPAAYGSQSPGGPGSDPTQGGIAPCYPGQNPTLSANPSQSSLSSFQQGPSMGGGAYPSQSGLSTPQQGHTGGTLAYPSQSGLFTSQQGPSMGGGPHPNQSGLSTPQHGQSMGGVPPYPAQQPNTAAYPSQQLNTAAYPSQGGSPLQQGQGLSAAGGVTLGGFDPSVFLGSNGKPMISGKPGSKPDKMCQLDKQTGVLISGCADHETSADAQDPVQPGKAYGAMTNALVTVVRDHYEKYPSTPLTNSDLVVKVQEHLAHAGFKQHPCLGCSKQNAKLAFAV